MASSLNTYPSIKHININTANDRNLTIKVKLKSINIKVLSNRCTHKIKTYQVDASRYRYEH